MATCYNDNPNNRTTIVYGDQKCETDKNSSSCPSGYTLLEHEKISGKGDISYCFGDIGGLVVPRFRAKCSRVKPESEFPGTDNDFFNCCTGITKQEQCKPGYCQNSSKCDDFIKQFCLKPENWSKPDCGCLLPSDKYINPEILGPPECVDNRCASNPQAYKTANQRSNKCEIVNCSINENQFALLDKAKLGNINLQNQCGSKDPMVVDNKIPQPTTTTPSDMNFDTDESNTNTMNTKYIFGIIGLSGFVSCSCIIIILFFAVIMMQNKSKNS